MAQTKKQKQEKALAALVERESNLEAAYWAYISHLRQGDFVPHRTSEHIQLQWDIQHLKMLINNPNFKKHFKAVYDSPIVPPDRSYEKVRTSIGYDEDYQSGPEDFQ